MRIDLQNHIISTKKEDVFDILIIGAGVIGAAIARELSQYQKKVVVLEANLRVGMETSAGNSGFVHGGFDPTPGKLNAHLNVLGKARYEDWIRDLEFPYLRINSTVVGFNHQEMEAVQELYQRGLTNGLQASELEIIDAQELQHREPNISKKAMGALVCNSSIALDTVELTKTLFTNAVKNGVDLRVNAQVVEITKKDDYFLVKTKRGDTFKSKVLINVAGHYADLIAKMAGYPDFKLIARRGEYRILEKSEGQVVNSVIFMVPTIHGKGVLVAPMLDGHLMVGPTAEEGILKADTRLITPKNYDLIGEIGKKIIPQLKLERTVMVYSGSRPIEPTSDDFYIKPAKNDSCFINVAGMKSPAIAAAPAIADLVIEMVKPCFKTFDLKKNWDPKQPSLLPGR